MVRETTIDIRRAGCANVEVHEMDAENIHFPDQSFDAVLCGFALWFFPHPDRALREFFRVLKHGGRLSLTTWAKDSPIQNMYRKALSAYAPPTDPKAPNIDTFGTTDSIKSAFRQAGFQPLLVDAEDAEFIYTSEDEPWAYVRLAFGKAIVAHARTLGLTIGAAEISGPQAGLIAHLRRPEALMREIAVPDWEWRPTAQRLSHPPLYGDGDTRGNQSASSVFAPKSGGTAGPHT